MVNMPKRLTRVVKLHALHARTRLGPLDYEGFFQHISKLSAPETVVPITGDLIFAIERSSISSGTFVARIVAGSPDEVPLYFDYTTGQTETGSTPDGKWLAKVTRILVETNPDARALAIESSRTGVTSSRLEKYFARLAKQTGWAADLTVDLPPVPSPSLAEEIERFSRIREAAAIVTRPNYDWSDMKNKLSNLADESQGHTAEAVVRADRKKSLSKATGIVGLILASLYSANPSLKDFRVTGRQEGSEKEVTINSEKHQARTFFDSQTADTPDEVDEKMILASKRLLRERENEATE